MRHPNLGVVLATLALSSLAFAQRTPTPTPAPRPLLDHFHVTAGTVQDLQFPAQRQTFRFQVWLGAELVTVELEPNDIRTPDFQLLVDDGQTLRQVPTPAPVTWRGFVLGKPESVAAGMVVDRCFDGMVSLESNAPMWSIQSAHNVDPKRPVTQHVVFSGANNTAHGVCGVEDHTHVEVPPAGGTDADKVAEIAIDADRDYYVKFGSNTTNVNNQVTSIINGVTTIYKRDCGILYTITAIVVRTAATYSGTNMSSLLQQFQSRWNSQHGSVKRDVAHLFTGKCCFSGVVGIAYLGVICNIGSAYGVDKAYSSFSVNLELVAHELGHNWAAQHCSGGGGTCRIMCAGLGGCSGVTNQFAPISINTIVSFKNSRGCLTNAATKPALTGMTPTTVEAFQPGNAVLTGSGLDTVTTVTFGTVAVTSGIVATATQVTVPIPAPKLLGATPVSVTNPAGTSNALSMTYTDTDPARIQTSPFGIGNSTLPFSFGGDINDSWFILVAFNSNATFPFAGFNILQNGLVLANGKLSNVGLGDFSFLVPNISLLGLKMYSQLIDIDDVNGQLNDVTSPALTTFF